MSVQHLWLRLLAIVAWPLMAFSIWLNSILSWDSLSLEIMNLTVNIISTILTAVLRWPTGIILLRSLYKMIGFMVNAMFLILLCNLCDVSALMCSSTFLSKSSSVHIQVSHISPACIPFEKSLLCKADTGVRSGLVAQFSYTLSAQLV